MSGKDQAVAPSRPIELTLVADFPSPWANEKDDTKELAVIAAGTWHPTVDDFQAVAEVPNPKNSKPPRTIVKYISTFGEFLGAFTMPPDRSIRRLNLISHAQSGLVSLGGKLQPTVPASSASSTTQLMKRL